jgi:dipeptidyl aminopeptidase/acylaminoacyl peptidase
MLSSNNEWGWPSGAFTGRTPTGWVLVVHGGGWQLVGKRVVAAVRPTARFFAAHGWGTYNIDYRPGEQSLTDVLSAYDALRRRVGARTPICAWGGSSGGQLVLLLAAYRPALRCVVSEAGPTDFLTLPSESAYTPAGVSPHAGALNLMRNAVIPAFGSSPASLWRWSPVRLARRIRARMLLGASRFDELVPQAQMSDMLRARRVLTRAMLLPGSWGAPGNFTHASITAAALTAWQRAMLALLAVARLQDRAKTP